MQIAQQVRLKVRDSLTRQYGQFQGATGRVRPRFYSYDQHTDRQLDRFSQAFYITKLMFVDIRILWKAFPRHLNLGGAGFAHEFSSHRFSTKSRNRSFISAHHCTVCRMNGVSGVMGTSRIFGAIEIAAGVLIATRLFSPRLSALGSAKAVVIFLGTLSFLLTTPGFDLLGMTTQFLSKDLVLLGASIWILERLFSRAPIASGLLP